MILLGLDVRHLAVVKISEHRTRVVLETAKGNGYAIYRDTHDGNTIVYANWKREHLEGEEKQLILNIIKRYS